MGEPIDLLPVVLRALAGLILGVIAVHLSDRSFTLASIRVTLVAIAATAPVVCVPVALIPSGYVFAGAYAVLALGAGAGFLHLVQVLAAVAGRGRPAPLRWAAPLVRGAVAAVILVFAVHLVVTVFNAPNRVTVGPLLGGLAVVGAAGLLGAAAIVSGRLGGGSILVPFAFALPLVLSEGGSSTLSAFIGAPLVVLAGMRAVGIGRRELGLLGITAWAPGDIALAPTAAGVGLLVAYVNSELGRRLRPTEFYDSLAGLLGPLALAGLFVLALRYLRGRIALAERARGARGPEAAGGAGPEEPAAGG